MTNGLRKIYFEISPTYELVNHAMTCGLDVIWRRKAARLAAARGGTLWLDVCSGTGEMASYLSRLSKQEANVIAADFSAPMIREAAKKPQASRIGFVMSDAKHLPFSDGTFDLVTTSYATRNMNTSRSDLTRCFAEFHRLLKPGGRYVSLETSQPRWTPIRKMFHLYVRLTVRPLGFIISGSRTGYAYLSHTIPRFYSAEELADVLRGAGFAEVSFQRLVFGAAAIHTATK